MFSNTKKYDAPIKEMMLLARNIPEVISLGQGMPNTELPAYILEEIQEIVKKGGFNKYSDLVGIPELRKAVAEHPMEKYTKCSIDFEKQILITCGAMEATMSALLSILDFGDEVILFSPYYPPHVQQVLLAGGKPVFVNLDESKNWSIDSTLLDSFVNKKTKAIIICNPSNPTGSLFKKEDIEKIIKIAKERDLFIINDETYNFLVYDDEKFCSPLHFPEKIQDHLISCFSFSKEFAMTGMRVGYMLAPEKIFEKAARIHDALTICAPTLSQKIALLMLQNKDKWNGEYLAGFKRRRDLMLSKLNKHSFSYCIPQGAYYFFVKYGKNISSKEMAIKLLNEAKVITIPGEGFGEQWNRYLRLSSAGEEREISQAIDRISEWMLK